MAQHNALPIGYIEFHVRNSVIYWRGNLYQVPSLSHPLWHSNSEQASIMPLAYEAALSIFSSIFYSHLNNETHNSECCERHTHSERVREWEWESEWQAKLRKRNEQTHAKMVQCMQWILLHMIYRTLNRLWKIHWDVCFLYFLTLSLLLSFSCFLFTTLCAILRIIRFDGENLFTAAECVRRVQSVKQHFSRLRTTVPEIYVIVA